MKLKGNLISTLYGINSPIDCLAYGYQNCFLAGTRDGEVITCDLDLLKKNVPSIIKQKLFIHDFDKDKIEEIQRKKSDIKEEFKENNKIVKILGLQTHPKALIGNQRGGIFLYDIEKNINESFYSCESEVMNMMLIDPEFSHLDNCVLSCEMNGRMQVFDIRVKKAVQSIRLGSLMGIPKALTSTKIYNQIFVGTLRGYLTRLDLKKLQFGESY